MFHRALSAVPASARAEPTSLLILVAGEFAPRVAGLWAAPHAEFLTAAAARRHLLCLAFSLGRAVEGLAESILDRRLPAAVAVAVGEAPAGLSRAIGRMGDLAWTAGAYRQLLALLADPKAAKVLRHAELIEQATIQRLAALPAPMSGAIGLAAQLDPRQAGLLHEAYEALTLRSGRANADAMAEVWGRLETPKALFDAVRSDLRPEPATPPHLGAFRLRPLATKAEFSDAAKRYRNCLVDQTAHAATGWSAYYEWTGAPGAVVEITRDHIYGWRLEQARIAGNEPVPADLREEIISELSLMGVHVGRSGWALERALEGAERRWSAQSVDDVVAEAFGAE